MCMKTAPGLDREVKNEWKTNGGSYEGKTKGEGCRVGTSSSANPKLCEGVEHADEVALGRGVPEWEHHELQRC